MKKIFAPGGSGEQLGRIAVVLAGVCTIIATILSILSIWFQFKNYRKPLLQRYVVRILLIVPIYAISSWISLESTTAAFFIEPIRDIYEAFTIYTFFQLLINFLGGERSLLIMTHGRKPTQHLWPLDIILSPVDISDPHTFLNVKRGILQYAWLKPILSFATIVMKLAGIYKEGYLGVSSGYLWTGLLFNISVSLSLYSLGMFWACMLQDLQPFRPMPKFLCVKLIIFVSYWQGFMLSIFVWLGWIPDVEYYTPDNLARAIQDALICFELPGFAIAHWYAFSWKDYADPTISSARMPVLYALRDAYGIRDLIEDSKITFAGNKYSYRAFDSAGETTMVHEESGGRVARMMEGMRYERGGKGKYWIKQPKTSSRTALLGAGGSRSGKADSPVRRAAEMGTEGYGTGDPDITPFEIDDKDETLYKDARTMEFGDYNYPVITAHQPSSFEHHKLHDDLIITTSTNQKVLQQRSQSRPRDKSLSSDRSKKGKSKASSEDEESDSDNQENRGLLSKVSTMLKRKDSDSSHFSDRSGIVDLIVQDKDAEEVERVRARKEGGPGWNDDDAKRYIMKYPDDQAGKDIRVTSRTEQEQAQISRDDILQKATESRNHFIVQEEDDEDEEEDNDNKPEDKGKDDKQPYETISEDNPWTS